MFENAQMSIILILIGIWLLFGLKKLLLNELQRITILIFNSNKIGFAIYAILIFPGTVVHELSHWLMAELLGVKTGRFRVTPRYNENHKTGISTINLGSVETAKTGSIRGVFIGIAPLISGFILLALTSNVLLNNISTLNPVWIGVLVYATVVLGNGMIVSRNDLRFWPMMVFMFAVIYIPIYKKIVRIPDSVYESVLNGLYNINKSIYITILIEFLVVSVIFLIRRVIEFAFAKIKHR